MNHTPGPWELGYSDLGSQIISSADGYVAVVHYWSRPEQEMKANARLIAASPDLLEACEEFVRKVECGEAKSKRSYTQMKAAIAKAGGES